MDRTSIHSCRLPCSSAIIGSSTGTRHGAPPTIWAPFVHLPHLANNRYWGGFRPIRLTLLHITTASDWPLRKWGREGGGGRGGSAQYNPGCIKTVSTLNSVRSACDDCQHPIYGLSTGEPQLNSGRVCSSSPPSTSRPFATLLLRHLGRRRKDHRSQRSGIAAKILRPQISTRCASPIAHSFRLSLLYVSVPSDGSQFQTGWAGERTTNKSTARANDA